jgi:hypothetical protein
VKQKTPGAPSLPSLHRTVSGHWVKAKRAENGDAQPGRQGHANPSAKLLAHMNADPGEAKYEHRFRERDEPW